MQAPSRPRRGTSIKLRRCGVLVLVAGLSGFRFIGQVSAPACFSCSGLPSATLAQVAGLTAEWLLLGLLLVIHERLRSACA